MDACEEDVVVIADLVTVVPIYLPCLCFLTSFFEQVQKGVNGAKADNTKGMKSAVINQITPRGQSLNPHIPQNVKCGHGFNHEHTGELLCPAGLN